MSNSHKFQAEVSKLLDIVINSLYSEKHIFLRELISNSSDACDKLKFLSLTKPGIIEDKSGFKIELIPDSKNNTLIIRDNGIGMDKEDLINHLGTIAKSGTANFLANIKDSKSDEFDLIGQFGVGFYSAFMVANKIELTTKKAGENKSYLWTSDGKTGFDIADAKKDTQGTEIKLYLKKDQKEFSDPIRLRFIVKTYSDHVNFPITLEQDGKSETINTASAIWTRNKSDITDEQYKEFYHHISHSFDEPWHKIHYKAEGSIEYTSLLYIPTNTPADLFQPERKTKLKLYSNKVFISDSIDGLIPSWLRFVNGIVDSSDLQLNISREMLQQSVILKKINNGLTKKIMSELKTKSKDYDSYKKFIDSFGPVLKEGIYEDFEKRADIAKLCRFASSTEDKLTSLDEYISRMPKEQKSIYYITGDNIDVLRKSPQLEMFNMKNIEVLLLTDPIDEFWTQALTSYEDKSIKSAQNVGNELDGIKSEENKRTGAKKEELDSLITVLKANFAKDVKDIAITEKLNDSPVCLSAEEGQMSIRLERLMKTHQQQTAFASNRILEINPYHKLIKKLAKLAHSDAKDKKLKNACYLLLDQAKITEGEPISDPSKFAKRLSDFIIDSF